MVGHLFHLLFYQPILNALVFLYEVLPFRDFGLVIILFTLILRALLHPLSMKALRSQRALQHVQPKLKALQEKHKNNPQEAARATMALYREHGVNPFGGFLPILVQLPILFALYKALLFVVGAPPEGLLPQLYAFVPNPSEISKHVFGGLLELTGRSVPLALLCGAAQYVQSHLSFKMMPPAKKGGAKSDFASAMAFQMRYVFPVTMAFIAAVIPAGVALYIFVTTLFSVAQQQLFNRSVPAPAEDKA